MMSRYPGDMKKGAILFGGVVVFAVFFCCCGMVDGEGDVGWKVLYDRGLEAHRNKETNKAIESFKGALSAVFPESAAQKFKKDEKTLRSLFGDTQTAARARYELGLIYDSQGKKDAGGILLRDALAIVASQNARYLGYKDGCKSCHFKEWKSWKETKMAKAFEVLKPGVKSDEKVKLKFDPEKDYTEDPNCLDCHTTGYGLPGGYHIPRNARYKVRRASEQAMGGTCEACHGPGSVYGPIHEDIDEKARPYTQEELYAAGEFRVDEKVCMRCHNLRNPTAGADFHFDFKENKDKDSHENFKLLYRKETPRPKAAAKSEGLSRSFPRVQHSCTPYLSSDNIAVSYESYDSKNGVQCTPYVSASGIKSEAFRVCPDVHRDTPYLCCTNSKYKLQNDQNGGHSLHS